MTHPRSLVVVVLGLAGALLVAGCGQQGATVTAEPAGTGEPSVVETPPPAAPCPPPDAEGGAAISWVPFVRIDGVMYIAGSGNSPVTVAPGRVGPVVATVRCSIGGVVSNPDFTVRDGDAAFLAAGTTLRSFDGADPDLRLAVEEDGAWRVYEADRRDTARSGADLLDLGGGAVRVELLDGETGRRVLGSVDDPAQVRAIVDAVLAARTVKPDYDRSSNPVFVRFVLHDGTAVECAWDEEAGILASVLTAPPELELLRTAGR